MDSKTHPFPPLDLTQAGIVCVIAAAGRSHVGNYAPKDRPRPRFTAQHLQWASDAERGCLYCGTLAPKAGEEHVLSVALGNWFWVIPPNVVCDSCNNEILSALDAKLQAHPFISLVRTAAGISGRLGQPPKVNATNLKLSRGADGDLLLEPSHPRHVSRTAEETRFTAKWTNFGPPQRRAVARSLLKTAVGVLWLARGPDETRRPNYDHVRDAIADVGDVPLQHGFGNSPLPTHALQITVTAFTHAPGLRVSLDYFGVQLWAQTEGYRHQANEEFLRREIDVEFAEGA